MSIMGRRTIDRILISTMPRSGTVYFFEFISKLFALPKLEPSFAEGSWPEPPEWDPYKFDRTYLELKSGQVLCAHYPLNDDINKLLEDESLLGIYLYRDPRDTAVSAVLYIKNVLKQHPLHPLFSRMSESEAITLMLSGGVIQLENRVNVFSKVQHINHEGIKYFCDWGQEWLTHPKVLAVRYEDFVSNGLQAAVFEQLIKENIEIDISVFQETSKQMSFERMTSGRAQGVEDKRSHFRKGVIGDHRNYFNDLHKAICKKNIGGFLIERGYEINNEW